MSRGRSQQPSDGPGGDPNASEQGLGSLRSGLLCALILTLGLSGCLPTSCGGQEPRTLYPSDSLSRQIAEETDRDTLTMTWMHRGPEDGRLRYPASMALAPSGMLWVADASRATLYRFDPTGALADTLSHPAFSYPFLGGFRGDTLLVLSRGAGALHLVHGRKLVRSVDLPSGEGLAAAAGPRGIFVKSAGTDPWWGESEDGYIRPLRLARDSTGRGTSEASNEAATTGTSEARTGAVVTLDGPVYARRGFLRSWGDSLLSLSGYRPAIDVVLPGGRLDTLDLRGFDSPMLPRRRAYARGEVDTPPLLTASAVPLDNRLYVLNMRPKHLQVDVYDRRGRLQRILTENPPGDLEAPDYFALDLAAFEGPDGTLRIAVVTHEPEPAIRCYRIR